MMLSRRLGHTPVRCKDMLGFIVNHAGRGMNIDGLKAAQEGVTDFVDINNSCANRLASAWGRSN